MEARRDEAERACKEFEARLAGMEDEIALTVERAVAAAGKEKDRILAEAEQAAQEIRRQAEAAVQAAMAAAQRGLQEEVAEQAAAMAEQLIASNLTPADHVAIIEQYLDKTGRATQ
jgi:F-type H+-transporting ATPase subunit b